MICDNIQAFSLLLCSSSELKKISCKLVQASIQNHIINISSIAGKNGFKLGTFIDSDILFLKKQNGKYVYNETEAINIMKNINTSDLEYAASISADGLEIFFTRFAIGDLKRGNIRSMIMCSTRSDISKPFGIPSVIKAIGTSDFVEGPAISGNERELYYHKREGNKNRLFKVTR